MQARPDVAIMLFDLSVSGVARNAVRVANAAHEAGLRTEVWLAQPYGELREAVNSAIVQRDLGAQLGSGYTRRQRKLVDAGGVQRRRHGAEREPECGAPAHGQLASRRRLSVVNAS